VRRAFVSPAFVDDVGQANEVQVPSDVAHRLGVVLRLVDEPVELFAGDGRVLRGRFVAPNRLVDVTLSITANVLPPLIVAQAMTKQDKLEDVAQRACELGASALWLFDAARSNVHVDGDRAARKAERLVRIMTDAARQSGRAHCPILQGPLPWSQLLAQVTAAVSQGQLVCVGSLAGTMTLSAHLQAEHAALCSHGALFVVGPEGGLSTDECAALAHAGACLVRWSHHVLRTETAALAALSIAQAALEVA
jgi:16S rRNA (uracil1498-N3)-methyltransferase